MRLLFVFLLGVFFQSCVTYEACKDKYGMTSDTVFLYKDRMVFVKDSTDVPADSLYGAFLANNPPINILSQSKILRADFRQDSGKIFYKIKYKQHTIYKDKYFKITEKIKATTTIWKTPIKKPWQFPKLKYWSWLLIIIGVFAFAYFIRSFRKL